MGPGKYVLGNHRCMKKRLHSFDAMRAIAMFLGVILHASIAYKLQPEFGWPVDHNHQSGFYDFIYFVLHLFRMELFFVIAGFFTRFLIKKIGIKRFAIHRFKRILLPFIIFTILLVPFSVVPFRYFSYCQEVGSFEIDFNIIYQMILQSYQRWNGLLHLWFLYDLIFFYTLTIGIISMKFIFLINYKKRLVNLTITNLSGIKVVLVMWGIVFLSVIPFETSKIPVNTGITPDVRLLMYYYIFFCFGYLLNASLKEIESLKSNSYLKLLVAISLAVIGFMMRQQGEGSINLILTKLVLTLSTVIFVISCLGFFQIVFGKESKFIRYFSDSTYWLYLIHVAIVAWMQIVLIDSFMIGSLKFFAILVVVNIISLFTYRYLVRYTFIGVLLHGPKIKKQSTKSFLLNLLNFKSNQIG